MMELLEGFPDDALAVRASRQVTRNDYETVLIPATNAAFARHKKLRVYYEIAPDFTGYDAGAMWEDFIVGAHHWTGWARVAIVTGENWVKNAANAFRFIMPCPVKVFGPEDGAEARAWLLA